MGKWTLSYHSGCIILNPVSESARPGCERVFAELMPLIRWVCYQEWKYLKFARTSARDRLPWALWKCGRVASDGGGIVGCPTVHPFMVRPQFLLPASHHCPAQTWVKSFSVSRKYKSNMPSNNPMALNASGLTPADTKNLKERQPEPHEENIIQSIKEVGLPMSLLHCMGHDSNLMERQSALLLQTNRGD